MRAGSSSGDGTTRRRTGGRICASLALLALACASERPPAAARPKPPPAPAAKPEAPPSAPSALAAPGSDKTAADPALQRDIAKLIAQCEASLGATGQVVDTRFERVEDPTVIESWFVARVGGEVVYLVKLTPSEQGVQVWVGCPPKPRVK